LSVRVTARFFSGVPHPHLLGVCHPDILFGAIGSVAGRSFLGRRSTGKR
jgi:hypothetical protein